MEDTIRSLSNGMAFVYDENVIGKWEFFDIIQSEDDFDAGRAKSVYSGKGYKEIYFLPNGQGYWIFEGWTKGFLFTHEGGDEPVDCHNYTIKKLNNKFFMFLEINDDKPYINVLKKISDKAFDLSEIGVHDNIDLPFVTDEHVIGLWKAIDYVDKINDFYVNKPRQTKMWLKSVSFNEDGTTIRIYDNEKWNDFWTKGFLMDTKK
jgi:hypothetical protein